MVHTLSSLGHLETPLPSLPPPTPCPEQYLETAAASPVGGVPHSNCVDYSDV